MGRKETSLEDVRRETKELLRAVPIEPNEKFAFIVQHPFTTSPWASVEGMRAVDLQTDDGYQQWVSFVEKLIDQSDIDKIFMLLNKPWSLTWLKFIKPYLSLKDFSEWLGDCWVIEENPNMDANVSIREAIEWFKEADKRVLMDEEDYAYWELLPEEVTLYRGVSRGREKYGLSWTDDEAVATWFKNRFATEEHQGMLLRVKANKKHCLCCLHSKGEHEIVLDVEAVKEDIENVTNLS